jgi:hypothetical protein
MPTIQTRITDREMGEKARRMPPAPRIVINGIVILPALNEDWQPIKDWWVLPGRSVATTQQLRDLASARNLAFDLIN